MGMGPVVRSLKDSMDGVPVHVRQLAEMFRKHGSAHKRNTSEVQNLDSADVTHPLQTAWRNDTDITPDSIVDTPKGSRPDPQDYLTGDYIAQHKELFSEGGVRFYTNKNLDRYGPGNAGTTFVFPKSEVDRIIAEAETPQQLGVMLGLGENFFVDADNVPVAVTRADFTLGELQAGGYGLPSGNEGGAHEVYWIPGGYLPDGIPEVVFTTHPGATAADPSAGGNWGQWDNAFRFGS
ncbi:hypothetical protein [Microbacterium sp. GXF0217]